MKKNYSIINQVTFLLLLLFSVHLTSFAQSKSSLHKNAKLVSGVNVARNGTSTQGGVPTTNATACGSYTWPLNGQTYSATGVYTSNGVTQGFNSQANWLTSVNGYGCFVPSNNLAGITLTDPIVLNVGGVTVTMSAPGGMYTSASFVGTNSPNDPLTITFSAPIYGMSANIFDTDVSDSVISGNVTSTYSTGFVDSRTVTANTELFGYTSTTPITSLVLSTTTTSPNRYLSLNNLFLALNPQTATLNLTINPLPTITCPGTITACQGDTVNYSVTSSSTNPTINFTQNTSSTIADLTGISCNPAGDNVYYRVYDLSTYGYTTDLLLDTIKFGVESNGANENVTVSAYTLSGAFSLANLTLLGSTIIPITTAPLTMYTANMGGITVPMNSMLVVAYSVPSNNVNSTFFPGSNSLGQSGPSYISSVACGVDEPTDLTDIGFPDIHVIIDFEARQPGASGTLALVSGLPSGSVFPVGTTTVTYSATDALGCVASCSFDVLVNAAPAITCPNNINACEGETVNYTVGGTNLTMNSGLPSGSVFPVGTTTVSYTETSAQGCESSCSFDVIVNPATLPTFTAVSPICSGGTLAPLPTTSNNGISGTWAPALDNTTTTTYTFTPNAGQCALTTTLTITVNPIVTPTFTAVGPICNGATLAPLPTTSTNGITGTWAPAINNTATTTYTFTPDAGQCVTSTVVTMTIVVNPLPTVNFTANPFPVCEGTGTTLTANPTNVVPTVNFVDLSSNSQSFNMNTAAFGTPVTSPLAGILANAPTNGCTPFAAGLFTGKIALIQRGGCTFTAKALNAQNAGAIGIIFYNNVAGVIVPGGVDPSITIPVYAVTQANGNALIAAMTAGQVNVTLAPAPPVSFLWSPNGEITNSINTGILNADTDFTVTVTNTATGCSNTVTVTVPVTPNVIPTFTQVAAICSGGVLAPLPTTSDNGIAGTWSPALDNTTTTTYTFTPTPVAGQCLGSATMTITVNQPVVPTFTQMAPVCSGATFALPIVSNEGITGTWSPVIDNTATTNYTFTPDAGQCASSTLATMTVTISPLPTVGFTANPFPVCEGTGTTLTANVTNASPTINFVDLSSANQSFAMNTAAFGAPVTSPLAGILANAPSNGCAPFAAGLFAGKIALIQRGGCTFAVKALNAQNAGAIGVIFYNNVAGAITPAGVDPSITIPVYAVTQANGNALIAAMTAGQVNVTLAPAPPVTFLWSPNGEITNSINTGILNADTDFTVTVTNTVTGCSNTVTVTVPVTPNVIPTFTQVAPICSGGTLAPLPTTSDNGVAGTWSPALDNTTTTTYTFTPTPVAGQCLGSATMTITVNNATTPVGDANQTISVANANDATLASLVVSPTAVVWYGSLADALAGTNPLPSTTVLTNGSTYYAVNVVGTCVSSPLAVTVSVTLGTTQFDDFNFVYSPNPTSSILNISSSEVINEVSVMNLLGQQIMIKKTNATDVQIDLSSLAEATYFVKVISQEKEKTVKVIKKN
jgi:hypothetical protein